MSWSLIDFIDMRTRNTPHKDLVHRSKKKKNTNSLEWFVENHQEIILDKHNGASGGW